MAKSPVKVSVFINEDPLYDPKAFGKRYSVTKMVFDRKTGMTLEDDIFGRGYSYEDACATKRRILASYAS